MCFITQLLENQSKLCVVVCGKKHALIQMIQGQCIASEHACIFLVVKTPVLKVAIKVPSNDIKPDVLLFM